MTLRKLLRLRNMLLLLAVSLIAITAALFVHEWNRQKGPPHGLLHNIPVGNAQAGVSRGNCEYLPSLEEAYSARLTLVVKRLDTAARTMTVEYYLCVPYRLQLRMTHLKLSGTAEAQEKILVGKARMSPWESKLHRRYESTPVGVITEDSEPSLSTIQLEESSAIPHTALVNLLHDNIGHEHRRWTPVVDLGSETYPIASAPRRYPFDWYALKVWLRVDFFPYFYGLVRGKEGFPFRLYSVLAGPTYAPLNLKVSTEYTRDLEHGVFFEFTHGGATRLYVIVIALIPLVLELLLCIVFVRLRRSDRQLGLEAIAGVAAVLLAILPIRAVLVPQTAVELTLVDYILGFEMAALAAFACVAVWFNLRTVSK
jgi:hypothetical protein